MKIYPEVEELLPHRQPFLFVDRILSFDESAGEISAELNLNADMWFFKGHFPSDAIMPGVLMTEGLAQTCGLLMGLRSKIGAGEIFYLASSQMKFTQVVRPQSKLVFNARLVRSFGGLYSFEGEVLCAEKTAASGNIVLSASKKTK